MTKWHYNKSRIWQTCTQMHQEGYDNSTQDQIKKDLRTSHNWSNQEGFDDMHTRSNTRIWEHAHKIKQEGFDITLRYEKDLTTCTKDQIKKDLTTCTQDQINEGFGNILYSRRIWQMHTRSNQEDMTTYTQDQITKDLTTSTQDQITEWRRTCQDIRLNQV